MGAKPPSSCLPSMACRTRTTVVSRKNDVNETRQGKTMRLAQSGLKASQSEPLTIRQPKIDWRVSLTGLEVRSQVGIRRMGKFPQMQVPRTGFVLYKLRKLLRLAVFSVVCLNCKSACVVKALGRTTSGQSPQLLEASGFGMELGQAALTRGKSLAETLQM